MSDLTWRILVGDVREQLATVPDGSVQCVCTSPPYWGLRDYGTATWDGGDPACDHIAGEARRDLLPQYLERRATEYGTGQGAGSKVDRIQFRHQCGKCGARRIDHQIGLEPTPDAYVQSLVEVFQAVWRVLKDDEVCWLNLGDSYATGAGAVGDCPGGGAQGERWKGRAQVPQTKNPKANLPLGPMTQPNRMPIPGLKPKDLCGIPWRVAFALQQPQYMGSIKSERDRIWLAAMLDAEGCMFIHKRKAGQHNGQGYYRQNDSYGPGVEIANTSVAVVERIMAIVGKGSICSQGPDQTGGRRRQTIYRWNLRTTESREFVQELYPYLIAKQQQARILYGCPSSGERAEAAHAGLISLHRNGASSVDFPPPPSLFSPGWYLRSDVIWSKANPMPESVTDRPTKAHEYIFLLSKSERYFYDWDALKEPALTAGDRGGFCGEYGGYQSTAMNRPASGNQIPENNANYIRPEFRNARSVWTITTQPYPEAHFATFPEALPERCIKAGSRLGDTVLDPFCGSGTTGQVAIRLGRHFIGVELNPTYAELARTRIGGAAPLFADEATA